MRDAAVDFKIILTIWGSLQAPTVKYTINWSLHVGNSLQLMNQPGLIASGVLVPQLSAEHVSISSAPHLHFLFFFLGDVSTEHALRSQSLSYQAA